MLSESIVVEPDGSRSVLVSFRGERCHAKIVDELPKDETWFHTGYTSMGYDIYQRKSIRFDPFNNYVAIKENKMKSVIEQLLSGKNVRDVLLKEDGGRFLTIEPGDYIQVGRDKAIVKDILFQDVYLAGPTEHIMSTADVEFHDENGKYRHWQSWSDGGTLVTNDGSTYRFEKET